MQEIWKDIPNYEGLYQISNTAKIKNIKRNKIKKQTLNKDGYYIIKLSKNNIKKVFLVHRLVAETFLDFHKYKYVNNTENKIINKEKLVINHKDENKTNNNVNNLEWCTNNYNIKYSSKIRKKTNVEQELYKYMKENNIDNNIIDVIMLFFNKK